MLASAHNLRDAALNENKELRAMMRDAIELFDGMGLYDTAERFHRRLAVFTAAEQAK